MTDPKVPVRGLDDDRWRNLPTNTNASKAVTTPEPRQATATTEEPSFIADLAKNVGDRVIQSFEKTLIDSAEMILNEIKNAVLDTMNKGFYGDDTSKYRRPKSSGYSSHYNPNSTTIHSNNDVYRKSAYDFTFIAVDTLEEAEHIKALMYEDIDNYGKCTIESVKNELNMQQTPNDHKFGWTSKSGIGYSRVNGRFEFRLPRPHQLD